jgi:hypothetical protein
MPPSENCRQNLMNHRRLSDDDFAEFVLHEFTMLSEFLQNIAEISRFTGRLLGSAQIKSRGKIFKRLLPFYAIS